MEKINDFVVSTGDDFYGVFDAADENNDSIDTVVANYLDTDPSGIAFSYDGRSYVLSKDSKTDNYTLHEQKDGELILKDNDVQIETKLTPDGFVELGGLTPAGTRLFMGRSPENEEQVIAFISHHSTDSVQSKPENAVVLFDGSSKLPEPIDTDVGDEQIDDSGTPADVDAAPIGSLPGSDFLSVSDLPDGRYEVKDDSQWYNSNGEWLGLSACGAGIYEVKNGELSRQLNVNGGGGVFIPANEYSGQFIMGATFTNLEGGTQVASFEFLNQNGAQIDQIELPYVSPTSGSFGVQQIDGKNVIVDSAGKVLGLTYSLEPGNYFVKQNGGSPTTYHQVVTSDGNSVFVPINIYTAEYEVGNQPILDVNGNTMRQPNGESVTSSYDQLVNKLGLSVNDLALPYIFLPENSSDKYKVIETDGVMLVVDIASDEVVGRAT